MEFVMGLFAMLSYFALLAAYIFVRPRHMLSVLDMFFVLFSLQFGPHAILPHPLREAALLVPNAYPAYAGGLALAYLGLAAGIGISGVVLNTRSFHMYVASRRDISESYVPIILLISIAYIFLFIGIEGFNLSRTMNYLNFFRGDSIYTYVALRREMYTEDTILSISAVTRQSTTAILFSLLIYVGIKFRKFRIPAFFVVIFLFIICGLQMNKFPFLYYTMITILVVFYDRAYRTGTFINFKTVLLSVVVLVFFGALLYGLYVIQYADSIKAGSVSADRILFRVFQRPFVANHDALYLWFAHFPTTFNFIGFANVKPIASLLGIDYFSPMVKIPALYTRVATTYQAGFIGSSYASFGYVGVIVLSTMIGAFVVLLLRQQHSLNVRWQQVVYSSVVGMNFYFLTSRELHTALLSGGVALVPIIFVIYRNVVQMIFRPRIRFSANESDVAISGDRIRLRA